MKPENYAFWSIPRDELLSHFKIKAEGLTSDKAHRRFAYYKKNILRPRKSSDAFALFIAQFKSPIILLLISAALLSFFLQSTTDAVIILGIVFASGFLGFWQERDATKAVEKLLSIVRVNTTVLRDGSPVAIPMEKIVPGDVVLLSAGNSIPGDCLILESKNLFVNEAALTGETYPVDKEDGILPAETEIMKRKNCLFMGTFVISGNAKALVVRTGKETEFGRISERLKLGPSETEFERGIRQFGFLLMEITLLLTIAIFAINVYLLRPVLDSFLFSLALAVGLTPQLLPAIVSINLAHGAKRMALKKVIVKKLASIENLGSMSVLCTDKTGTITEGVAKLKSAMDLYGNESEKVHLYAYMNSFYEAGFANPIDDAIRNDKKFDVSGYCKLDEVPYDFVRKRLSVLVSKEGEKNLMITKGALDNVLEICSSAEIGSGKLVEISSVGESIKRLFGELSRDGFRVLGIAYKDMGSSSTARKEHEADMTFLGFIVLFDPPKTGIFDTIKALEKSGVSLKIITGDNKLVAASIGYKFGLSDSNILTGSDIHRMSDEALIGRVNGTSVFAEVEPNQKERIINALKRAGNVVGYMGEGINDASALRAADVGISVNGAVDVAKEAADIVLLEKDLDVLVHGVAEGRATFTNTLKYVFMATSANFGNMFSMAGVSLFLQFLPLLPMQVLLTNMMTDIPEMTIATDRVDSEMTERPRRWDIGFIRKFMTAFGLLSSVFDYVTFGVLLFVLNATMEQFRTGWFIESVISASMIVLVIRSRKPFFKSMPGRYLLAATLIIALLVISLPFTSIGEIFGFSKDLPPSFFIAIGAIVLLYMISAEILKKIFYAVVKS